ncbi:hypothetical protein L917_01013 [Phytophthora nicotianae]|uniref:Uncharacterized protein n=1 Tax=Phytophthora nicotianae TaxID=4792 RepID=W2LYL3_PHYNI|nr:hypothetical protein L917_01013 [Phytophthora nicotianae]
MPVQCSKNVSLALKLANGTIGYIVAIQPSPTAVFQDINCADFVRYFKPEAAALAETDGLQQLELSQL